MIIDPTICRLFFSRRPSAIGWRVACFIVGALNGEMRCWSKTHVSDEVSEIMPAVTNGNAPSSIVAKGRIVMVLAALTHSPPYMIFRRSISAMSSGPQADSLILEASTRAGIMVQKDGEVEGAFLSAVAAAEPAASTASDTFNGDQKTKSLTSDINVSGHGDLLERLLVSSGGRALQRSAAAL